MKMYCQQVNIKHKTADCSNITFRKAGAENTLNQLKTMEPFLNKKYKLDRCENLDELLDEMDVNAFIRKIASSISTTVQLLKKGDEYTLNTKMLILTTTQKFKLGAEKEVTTTDGRKVKNVFTIDGNVLTEKQIGERTLTIVREFFDDEMIATSYYGNVVCKGYCKLLKQ